MSEYIGIYCIVLYFQIEIFDFERSSRNQLDSFEPETNPMFSDRIRSTVLCSNAAEIRNNAVV